MPPNSRSPRPSKITINSRVRETLAAHDACKAELVKLRYFVGLMIDEVTFRTTTGRADATEMSPRRTSDCLSPVFNRL